MGAKEGHGHETRKKSIQVMMAEEVLSLICFHSAYHEYFLGSFSFFLLCCTSCATHSYCFCSVLFLYRSFVVIKSLLSASLFLIAVLMVFAFDLWVYDVTSRRRSRKGGRRSMKEGDESVLG